MSPNLANNFLIKRFERAFIGESLDFAILHTIHPKSASKTRTPPTPKTLYILDSSFNPPTRAHLSLAISALRNPLPSYPGPYRLLLLLATHNAEKKPAPASDAERLEMMVKFAEDLQDLYPEETRDIAIDVGATTMPYYTDKTEAIVRAIEVEERDVDAPVQADELPKSAELLVIQKSNSYALRSLERLKTLSLRDDETSAPGLSKSSDTASTDSLRINRQTSYKKTSRQLVPTYGTAKHLHLLGFDTLTRFLAPKYYTNHNPPLSALAPFFEAGHGLICTQRAESSSDMKVEEGCESAEAQEAYLKGLTEGEKVEEWERQGWRREWAKQVVMVLAEKSAVGVSSSVVRKAVKAGGWDEVEKMCTRRVVEYVKNRNPYAEDAEASKLA